MPTKVRNSGQHKVCEETSVDRRLALLAPNAAPNFWCYAALPSRVLMPVKTTAISPVLMLVHGVGLGRWRTPVRDRNPFSHRRAVWFRGSSGTRNLRTATRSTGRNLHPGSRHSSPLRKMSSIHSSCIYRELYRERLVLLPLRPPVRHADQVHALLRKRIQRLPNRANRPEERPPDDASAHEGPNVRRVVNPKCAAVRACLRSMKRVVASFRRTWLSLLDD
jgi:hypothetical protein